MTRTASLTSCNEASKGRIGVRPRNTTTSEIARLPTNESSLAGFGPTVSNMTAAICAGPLQNK